MSILMVTLDYDTACGLSPDSGSLQQRAVFICMVRSKALRLSVAATIAYSAAQAARILTAATMYTEQASTAMEHKERL